jgi:hypothetical protein
MDCSICLNDCSQCANTKLLCNHTFHTKCIKEWYLKGDDCPMCRGKLYFRGMSKTHWVEEKANQSDGSVIETLFDEIIDDFKNINAPRFMQSILGRATMDELRDTQITFNVLREDGVDDDTIYDAIADGLYTSPRIKYFYMDEKNKKKYSRYSKKPRMGKNVRVFY